MGPPGVRRCSTWARWAAWLDKYVKNPQKAEPAKKVITEAGSR
jgi:hypothetical protein